MVRLKIADHIVEWVGSECEAMVARTPNYPLFVTDEAGRAVLRVEFDRPVATPLAEPLLTHNYNLASGNCTLRYWADRYLLTIRAENNAFTANLLCPLAVGSDEEPLHTFHTDFPTSAPTYRYLLDHLMVFAYSLATIGLRTLLIHSSTIVHQKMGVMFLGESGTGKSTHTRLWLDNIEGCYRLNDDGPIIRTDGDMSRVYGSPWSGSTPCYKDEVWPLVAMVRLRQAPHNRITRQTKIGAFGAVLPSSLPTLQKREEDLDKLCTTLSELVSTTPIYIMECLPDADAAHTSHNEIFSQK